jgi:hypothetical protein
VQLRDHQARDTCNAQVERSSVGGIEGTYADKLMIDDGPSRPVAFRATSTP